MEEIYKNIENFPDYMVSNLGNIKSYKRLKKGVVLKNIIGGRGYPLVNLMKEGKMFQFDVHRLVAIAFIENNNKMPFVNHKDLDKTNNKVSNLEWVSGRENVTHYYNSINTSSKYIGVHNYKGTFIVKIHVNKKRLALGSYKNEEEARDVYIIALKIFEEKGVDELLKYKSQLEDKFTSKFKGVSFDKVRKKWVGNVFFKNKHILRKRFDAEFLALEAVIKVYKEYSIPLHYSHKEYLKELKCG